MIKILKVKLETKLRKVVLLLKRGNYNIYKVIEKIFKLITLVKYPFGRWLKRIILFMKKQVESFNNSFINKENSIKDSTSKIEEISSSGSENKMGKISSAGKTLSLIMFNGKNKYKILFVLFSIFTLIFIGKIYSFNFLISVLDGILNPSPIIYKYFLLASSIIYFILILRYIIFISSIYLISKGKLSKSIFKPFFLNNLIDRLQNLTSEDKLEFIIDYYYKHLYIYIVLFIFAMLLFIMM